MKDRHSRFATTGWTLQSFRRSCLIAASIAIATLAACGGDSPAAPAAPVVPKTPTGSYTIQTVNGKAPPVAVYADGGYLYELTLSTVVLGVDGQFSIMKTYRQTVPGDVETFIDSIGGAWVQTGSSIQFTSSADGSVDKAVWTNGLLTFAESDGTTTTTFVYLEK